jgi:hypothetical protein
MSDAVHCTLLVRTLPPYPRCDGTVTLAADPRPDGAWQVRFALGPELEPYNPVTAHSMTEPVFFAPTPEDGFGRAIEWLRRHFAVLGVAGDAEPDTGS